MSTSYEEFVKYIFHEHIEKRLTPWKRRHLHHFGDLGYEISRLTKAIRTIRFVQDFAESDEQLTNILTPETLKTQVDHVREGLAENNRVVVETGIADLLQDYLKEIVEGMSAEQFPQVDVDALREAGSSDPQQQVSAIVHLMKSRKDDWIRNKNDFRFSRRLIQAREELERISERLPKESPKPIKENQPAVKRAIFKGIGSIGQGALLTLTDVSLLTGMWGTSLSSDTTTVGAVVSITSGIGLILTGVGELRGE